MPLAEFTLYMRLLPPIFLGWTAWVVGRAPFQERANRILATFLMLVGLGFLFEFLWQFFAPTSSNIGVSFRAAQLLVGVMDPPFLLAYALVFSKPHTLAAPRPLWMAYGLAGLALFFAGLPYLEWDSQNFRTSYLWYILAQTVYVNGTYLVAFILILHGFAREERRFLSRQLTFLSVGIGLVALSRSAILFNGDSGSWAGPTTWWNPALYALLVALAILGIVHLFRPRAPGRREAAVRRVERTLAFLLVGFFALWGFTWIVSNALSMSGILFGYFYSYRWVVFSIIVGFGILRFQLFDFEIRARQALALLVAIVVGLVVAMSAALLTSDRLEGTTPSYLLGFLAGLASGLPSYVVVRRLLGWFGPEDAGLAASRKRQLSLYEATLEFALQKPTWTEEEQRFVETLWELFEITPEEHEHVLARLRTTPPPATGARPA